MVSFYLYALTALVLWVANVSGIRLLIDWGFQRNVSAALIIPFLAIISYAAQKFIVFPGAPMAKSGAAKLFNQPNGKS